MLEIFNFLKKDNIGEPPWKYDFLVNLDEKEYPRYLAKLSKLNTGENLPLKYNFKNQAWVIDKKRCKTFNQKIQWLKLYGVTDLMRKCTDKVAVRDYVKEKIGEEYLKPVLQIIPNDKSTPHPNPLPLGEGTNSKIQGFNQKMKADKLGGHPLPTGEGWGEGTAHAKNDVSTYFDQINWNKLPNAFVIKCNHGCKWQYIIKDKEQFLNTPKLFEIVKRNITGWLEQEYWQWGGFEMQYKGIEPKILIEPLMSDKNLSCCTQILIFCFNGKPTYIENRNNEQLNIPENLCVPVNSLDNCIQDEIIKKILHCSKKLSEEFMFVRVDWMLFNNKAYFEELTFTSSSGFNYFNDTQKYLKFGKCLNLER